MVHGLWSIVLDELFWQSGSGVSPLNEQSRDGSATLLNGAMEANAKRMRERSKRRAGFLTRPHSRTGMGTPRPRLEKTLSRTLAQTEEKQKDERVSRWIKYTD